MGKQKYRKNNLDLVAERLAEILVAQANFKKNKVNWNDNNTKVFNWIRAFIFPPLQYPIICINGNKFFIRKAELGDKLKKGKT